MDSNSSSGKYYKDIYDVSNRENAPTDNYDGYYNSCEIKSLKNENYELKKENEELTNDIQSMVNEIEQIKQKMNSFSKN
jgi:predicted  nucleic acid-binding Zn-ribbon protein